MNIFLGSVYPKPLLQELKKRKLYADYPADIFQHSLLRGLDKYLDDLWVISSPVIKAPFKTVKEICKGYLFSHNNEDNPRDLYIGTVPIIGLQMIVEFWRVYKELKNRLNNSENNVLIIYALHSPFLLAATLLRRKIDCSCVVVPDLPEFMTGNGSFFRLIAKKIDRFIINYCLRRMDCYALLSPFMRDSLPIKNKSWVLVEGIYDTSLELDNITKNRERTILYTGSLSKRYGILELIEAFHQIDNDNYCLWICGDGDGKENVLKMAEVDKRVVYKGVVSHDEVLVLQRQATVLVNPRSSKGEYTKYSFPSKTMEYLASGTPTIMCHLPAIPAEYDDFIFYFTDESVEGIKHKLIEICVKPDKELASFGKKASDFIKNKKNAVVQTGKIIELISRKVAIRNPKEVNQSN